MVSPRSPGRRSLRRSMTDFNRLSGEGLENVGLLTRQVYPLDCQNWIGESLVDKDREPSLTTKRKYGKMKKDIGLVKNQEKQCRRVT